jgi:anhydro-N-acetylmuramic acid kinase
LNIPYDADGQLASKGIVSEDLLLALKNNAFFTGPVPKTTGPELFNLEYLESAQKVSKTQSISIEDILATLCRFTAETITETIKTTLPDLENAEVFMSGGGMHNPMIVGHLQECMPGTVFYRTDDIGIDGDAKEAVLFATLANEALAGGKTDFGSRRGVPSVSMGKVSFPN